MGITSETTFWQLYNGDSGRDFSELFFNFGVACIGPGRAGKYDENEQWYIENQESRKIKPITEIKKNDIILLKNSQREVQALGLVEDVNGTIYHHSDFFSDVDGWDLQHYVKVKWKRINHTFKDKVLTRSTLQRISHDEVVDWIKSNWDSIAFENERFSIENDLIGSSLDFLDIETALIDNGMRIEDAEKTTKTIARIKKLATWYLNYYGKEIKASEHETRTFLVVPLLEALGWSPQQMGIEVSTPSGRIDIVLYEDNKRKTPKVIIETKILYSGFSWATKQAQSYIQDMPTVEKFVVGDGYRYWLYLNKNGSWIRHAYMNFENMKKFYCSYPDVLGMIDFLRELSK